MFALPLGVMAQAKFGHMNSQEVISALPEFKKAQTDLETMQKIIR
jgi:outer membrane protein